MKITEAGGEFEKLINSSPPLEFVDCETHELPKLAAMLTHLILENYGIKWKVSNVQVDEFICLKLDDPYVQYVDIGHQFYMWCDEGHHNSIHPDKVITYLFKKYKNIEATILSDRSVQFKPIKEST